MKKSAHKKKQTRDKHLQKKQFGYTTWMVVVFIFILTFIVYSPALENDFIWDDDTNIYENSALNQPGGLLRIWGSFDLYQYYPLTFTSFYLEHQLWGFNPTGYHVTNILLHAANAILVFFLLLKLGLRQSSALFIASLFAIHPIQAESVAWATERKNLLSGLFYFSSFLFYLKFLDTNKNKSYGLSLFFFLCALLSKTVTVTLPLTLLLAEYLRGKSINRKSLLRISVFFAFGIVMGLITTYMEAYRAGAVGQEWNFSILQRIIIASRVMLFYADKIVLPINMCFIYPQWQIDPSHLWDYWPALLLIGMGALLWQLRKRATRLVWFAIGHYFVSLLPASGMISFFYMRYSFVQNHFQYLAGLGIMILIVTLGMEIISRIVKKSIQSKVWLLAASVVLIGCGFMTYDQCKIYRNNKTLWYDTIAKSPKCWMAYSNLGYTLNNQGNHDEGIQYLKKAIAINPDFIEAHNSLGVSYYNKGMLDEAISEYKKALTINPDYEKSHSNLGVAYHKKGMLDEAISAFKQALAINSNIAVIHYQLGLAYSTKGMPDESISEYKKTLSIDPDFIEAHGELGVVYHKKGEFDRAISEYKRAIALNPRRYAKSHGELGIVYYKKAGLDNAISKYRRAIALRCAEAHGELGVVYHKKGEFDRAISEYKQAIALNPRYAKEYNNLGNAYLQKDALDKAINAFSRALDINPRYAKAHNNLGSAYLRKGALDKAIAEYKQAIVINPGNGQAHNNLSVAYYYKGNFKMAIQHSDKALDFGASVDSKLLEMLKDYR